VIWCCCRYVYKGRLIVAIEHIQQPDGTGVLPSQRVAPVPTPGSAEAAFLANLNEVYGEPDAADDGVVEGIRQAMGRVLEREQ